MWHHIRDIVAPCTRPVIGHHGHKVSRRKAPVKTYVSPQPGSKQPAHGPCARQASPCGEEGFSVNGPPRLSVIAISDAFRGFWSALADDLHAAIDVVGPAEAVTPQPETVAVIVAAGGVERDAIRWFEDHRVPLGLPTLVVGTDPGRRTAMQLVARGASDYFALPDDLEIFRNALAATLAKGRARVAVASNGPADAFAGIVGESEAIKKELARAARLWSHPA